MAQQHSPRSRIRVAIVDDHVLFGESLELALSVEGYDVRRPELPDDPGSPGSLLSAVTRSKPAVVLLDLDLGRFGDGVRLVGPLAKAGINVVVVTSSLDRARWGDALRLGARTVLPKSRPLNDIMSTVRRLHQGLPVMDREEREDLLRCWQRQRAEHHAVRDRIDRLTARAAQVLGHLMRGQTVHEIAATSFVSEATVRTQVKAILAKLEVSSQIAAVGLAHQIGWHPPVA
jgi:DNA-binding NarL/FixJ family response regulator